MANGDRRPNFEQLMNAGDNGDDVDSSDTCPIYSDNLAVVSKEVQRRIRALKKYQLETIDIESKFYQRVHELEKEFQPLYNAVNEKRKAVVTGLYEPLEDECNVPLVHGLTPEELQKLEKDAPNEAIPSKGVPDFWLYTLTNSSEIGYLIQERDVPVLKHLIDIKTELHTNPSGFSLLFEFTENPYFNDRILKKDFELKITPCEDDPFNYDGLIVIKSQGTMINWKPGMDVTKQTQTTEQGLVVDPSIFDFFNPNIKEISDNMDEDARGEVIHDFEIGQTIRDVIIPRAVLYFTGEVINDDDYSDDYEDNDSSDGEEVHMEE